jgi:hypothetical protein
MGGFRGVNPGFTHFGGLGPVLGSGSFSQHTNYSYQTTYTKNLIFIHSIILYHIYIYIYTGGGYIGGIWGIGLLLIPPLYSIDIYIYDRV